MKPIPSHPAIYPPPPVHIAIIMDGNGRWAKARGMPRVAGHRRGAEAVRTSVRTSIDQGVSYLTLYGFSLENWKRPQPEVTDLMGLLRLYLRQEVDELDRNGVRVKFIGELDRLSPDIVTLIAAAEEQTRANTVLTLVIALSYGGRQEITRAARQLVLDVLDGSIDPAAIGEEDIAGRLWTADIPDPDLIIRTSGEKRISNFLLWQSAYAELVFTDTLWPDFGAEDLEGAIKEYQRRDRRYGATAG